jgi:hypothetical protein
MKKILFLLLGLAVAGTAAAGGNLTPIKKSLAQFDSRTNKVEKVTRASGIMPTPASLEMGSNILRGNRAATTWDFEDATQFTQFTLIDADGDGFNWTYYNNDDADAAGEKHMTTHGGVGVIASASYDNDTQVALTPDNWLISPQVTLGGALSFWAMGQDASYCAEKFAVYVCVGDYTGVESFTKVAGDFTATDAYVQYEIDLSAYQGQVGYFAIVHHNITDMFFLNVDDIVLDADAQVLPYPVVPEVTVNPAATTADVAWGADAAAEGWNLRYRPYVDTSGNPINITLPADTYEAELDGIAVLDADGDGDVWSLYYTDDAQTDLCLASASYGSNGAMTPDNWLIMPLTKLQGIIRFDVWNHSSTYPEMLQVMIGMEDAIDGNTVYTDQFTTIKDFTISGTAEAHETVTLDLTEYNGQNGYVVFRHTGTTDMWRMYLDNIFIGDPNAEIIQPAEWIYVNELTANNYTIDGLTPETQYEVQVMGYNASHESEWCDIVTFFTTADVPAGLRGDVDNSQTVNIADVTALIDGLLSGNWDGANYDNADCNLDGGVNIADVTALIDYLLSGVWSE